MNNPDILTIKSPKNQMYLRITPEGKLRGPIVNRALIMVGTTGFLSGLLGALCGRLV